MKFNAKVTNNKIILNDRTIFDEEIKKLNGKDIQIDIGAIKSDRSDRQNKYYWAVVVDTLSNELGYTPKEMHEILKYYFLSKEMDFKGDKFMIGASTTDLNTKEMETFLDKVRQWASIDLHIFIPLPNENEFSYL